MGGVLLQSRQLRDLAVHSVDPSDLVQPSWLETGQLATEYGHPESAAGANQAEIGSVGGSPAASAVSLPRAVGRQPASQPRHQGCWRMGCDWLHSLRQLHQWIGGFHLPFPGTHVRDILGVLPKLRGTAQDLCSLRAESAEREARRCLVLLLAHHFSRWTRGPRLRRRSQAAGINGDDGGLGHLHEVPSPIQSVQSFRLEGMDVADVLASSAQDAPDHSGRKTSDRN
mmetsp:Transcript_57630/g.153484  ORF Transcript_57630/g.153484 Transcript_57630/m.153484 type:complete len:227 (-) Transcript_57630:728-1408(-)